MNDVGKLKESNDKLGLTSRWIEVPKEIERPESAVLEERKSGYDRIRYLKWSQQYARSPKRKGHKGSSQE